MRLVLDGLDGLLIPGGSKEFFIEKENKLAKTPYYELIEKVYAYALEPV